MQVAVDLIARVAGEQGAEKRAREARRSAG
jgi:hypothetical protein